MNPLLFSLFWVFGWSSGPVPSWPSPRPAVAEVPSGGILKACRHRLAWSLALG